MISPRVSPPDRAGNAVSCGLVQLAPPGPLLGRFVRFVVLATLPRAVAEQVSLIRLPEAGARVVFTIEEGPSSFGGRYAGPGLSASLFLIPPHLRALPIPSTVRQLVAATLQPPGLGLIARGPGPVLRGSAHISLESLWGEAASDLLSRLSSTGSAEDRARLLTCALEARMRRVPPPNYVARRAAEIIATARGEIALDSVAASCGCTARTVRASVTAETGLAPKHLARIARLRHAVDLLAAGVELKEAAANACFADQAHMTREFRALIGEPPRWLARSLASSKRLPVVFLETRAMTEAGLLMATREPAGRRERACQCAG